MWDANLESWLDRSSKKKTQLKVIYGHKLKKKIWRVFACILYGSPNNFFVIAAYFFCNFQYFQSKFKTSATIFLLEKLAALFIALVELVAFSRFWTRRTILVLDQT